MPEQLPLSTGWDARQGRDRGWWPPLRTNPTEPAGPASEETFGPDQRSVLRAAAAMALFALAGFATVAVAMLALMDAL